MPVWRLTDNSDSISGQRRKRKYQRPTEGERRAIIDAHLAGDEWKTRLQNKRGTAWSIFARYQYTGEVVCRPRGSAQHQSVGRREQGPAGDVSGGQSPVDAETSGPSSCSSQGAGGAGGDAATLDG